MQLAFGSLILLVVALRAFSAPLPQVSPPTDPVSPPATQPAPPVPPAQAPSQLDVTSPIKFSDLNGPSQGVAFNDFAALPIQKGSSVAGPLKRYIGMGDVEN